MIDARPDAVVVCGGRNYLDVDAVYRTLDGVAPAAIVHGGASGADTLAARWAKSRGVPCAAMPADWQKHGRAAGPIRNRAMADELLRRERSGARVAVIAFPGGVGTQDMIRIARDLGIRLIQYVGDDQ